MSRQQYWNHVYQTKGPQDVSWYQRRPELSLALIAASGLSKDAGIIDVGGGASMLIDYLLDAGYTRLAVLDVSEVVLTQTRIRLGSRADSVEWFETDVTTFEPPHRFGLWHDRAVFHFLMAPEDRHGYVEALRRTLQPGGTVVVATFAIDGTPQCSDLPVMRYDEQTLLAELGPEFIANTLRRWLKHLNVAPLYIEPGSPWENGYIESFNGKMRAQFLDGELFYTLKEAQIMTERWRRHYNTVRPHGSLRGQPPVPETIQLAS
jgi:transposase InsO family protein